MTRQNHFFFWQSPDQALSWVCVFQRAAGTHCWWFQDLIGKSISKLVEAVDKPLWQRHHGVARILYSNNWGWPKFDLSTLFVR
jgi:hypothetical protein